MKLNIHIGWFVSILAVALVAGYFGSMAYAKMQANKGNGADATEGGEVLLVDAPAVAV